MINWGNNVRGWVGMLCGETRTKSREHAPFSGCNQGERREGGGSCNPFGRGKGESNKAAATFAGRGEGRQLSQPAERERERERENQERRGEK